MHSHKKTTLSGWGQSNHAECAAVRPEHVSAISEYAATHESGYIARGLGRAYGDAALCENGVIDMLRLDQMLSFDEMHGRITVEAGASFADILDIIIPKGWILPVIAGTKHITAGGAVACNIHGKNQYQQGDIGNHIEALVVYTKKNEPITCSAEQNSELFHATIGGMGMTGVITEVTFSLRPITSTSLRVSTQKFSNISDMVALFHTHKEHSDYMVGWIDHAARGNKFGRGVFESASHIDEKEGGTACAHYQPAAKGLTIPSFFPSWCLNRYSMALYNAIRFWRFSNQPTDEIQDFHGFFHPLDNLKKWYRLYGKKGFFQYQCIIPEDEAIAQTLQTFMAEIHTSGLFSYLAVIKYHRDSDSTMLPFSKKGFSIALDFPNTPEVRRLLQRLNEAVIACSGKIYLAKDAVLTKPLFQHMYHDDLEQWRKQLAIYNPDRKVQSAMAERLGF